MSSIEKNDTYEFENIPEVKLELRTIDVSGQKDNETMDEFIDRIFDDLYKFNGYIEDDNFYRIPFLVWSPQDDTVPNLSLSPYEKLLTAREHSTGKMEWVNNKDEIYDFLKSKYISKTI